MALGGDKDWWRGAVIYQIYPRSYQDTNGDGIGDLPGITQRLDHIASLGVDAVWISPFYTSPMDDFGYDVSNYRDVDPIFGTLADFDALLEEAHARGLRVMIDLVLSHTSDRHPWFTESRAGRENPKSDWYVWADAKPDGTPPNNWLSIFGGPAWEWDTRRSQYYLHNFLKSQPDLNFHNRDVQDALLDVTRFWLERGVDGFRLDTVNFYFHDAELRDNPPWTRNEDFAGIDRRVNPYGSQDHLYDKTRPENLDFLARFRQLLDEYPGTTAVGEIGADRDEEGTMAAYTEADKRIHMAYNFRLLGPHSQAEDIAGIVQGIDRAIGSGWPCWSLSNHDVTRVPTRWAPQADPSAFQPVASAMLLSLRGTICLYQGEELGLPEADVPFEALQDPQGKTFWPEDKGRDGCRTPMPWTDSEAHAGFSTVDGWLPMPSDHAQRAVSAQENDEAAPLNRLRRFLAWRSEQPALVKGDLVGVEAIGERREVVVVTREAGGKRLTGAFNLTGAAARIARPRGERLDVPGFAAADNGAEAAGTKGEGLTLPPFSCAFFAA